MKWQKASQDFPSEKTFVIIKDNFHKLDDRDAGNCKNSIRAGNTGTWPPKIKKRSFSSYQKETDRPQTANLEKPSILNPNLVDKLDMSLLSKEVFCHSMNRIQLDAVSSGGASSTSSSVSRRRQSVPITAELHRHTRTGFTCRSTRKKHTSLRDSNEDLCRISLSHSEPTSSQKLSNPGSRKINGKLDNNNNRRISSLPRKVSSLSNLKWKSIKNNITSDVTLIKSFTNKDPESCASCGQKDQSERLDSIQKLPILKTKNGRTNLKSSKTFIAKKNVQKSVTLNLRSSKNKKGMDKNLAPKIMFDRKRNTSSPPGPKSRQTNSSTVGSVVNSTMQGPRTVTCYICSREYGTASFPIHEPKCLQRWERENKALPLSQRRPTPERPKVSIDHPDWNAAAWEKSQIQLIPCLRCGRTFFPDRLLVHKKSCKVGTMNAETENQDITEENSNRMVSGPPAVVCEICGRNFGTKSIMIHKPQCLKKWHSENEKLPSSQRKIDSPPKILFQSQKEMSIGKLLTESQPKLAFMCYICGMNFGSASISIHETQCLKKWHSENNKLPLNKRKKEPEKPDALPCSSPEKTSLSLTESAETSWKKYLGQLVPCKRCGRTFNPDRVAIHERSCKKI